MTGYARTVRNPETGKIQIGYRGDGLPTHDWLPLDQAAARFTDYTPNRRFVALGGAGRRGLSGWDGGMGVPPSKGASLPFLPPGTNPHPAQLRPTFIPPGNTPQMPGGRVHPFFDPGAFGGCPPRGKGLGYFGCHSNDASTAAATSRETNVRPEQPVRVTQIVADGPNLNNWICTKVEVNRMVVKHGGTIPMSVFSPYMRYPVPFDWRLGTGDLVTFATQEVVLPAEPDGNRQLKVAGQYCFMSNCMTSAYPCDGPILKEGTRQIIIGLGTGVALTQNSTTATALSDTADADTLLGNFILEATLNGTNPDESPRAGENPANGQRALEYIAVSSIDIQTVRVFTTSPSNTGTLGTGVTTGIPASAFAPESGGVFFPDLIVDSSLTINVNLINRAPAGAGTATNAVSVYGAIVGCMLACDVEPK